MAVAVVVVGVVVVVVCASRRQVGKNDSGWWEGRLNGEAGWFPASFVDAVPDKEQAEEADNMAWALKDVPAAPAHPTAQQPTRSHQADQMNPVFAGNETVDVRGVRESFL